MTISKSTQSTILLTNLLDRFKPVANGGYTLSGELTEREMDALKFALNQLSAGEASPEASITDDTASKTEHLPSLPESHSEETSDFSHRENEQTGLEEQVAPSVLPSKDQKDNQHVDYTALNTSIFDLPLGHSNSRVCLDFGTAMSKATLVHEDEHDDEIEDIEVITLGIPGDQEEISENMLISSVFIDDEGSVWFGKAAVEMSRIQTGIEKRQRIDNIKRYLSEEGLGERVPKLFNPTNTELSFEDMVLAYLAYFTWTMNEAISPMGYNRNISRRYAMPCLDRFKHTYVSDRLKLLLGQAQVLADTFATQFNDGIHLDNFVNAIKQVRELPNEYLFVKENVTEPLGVAGSLISWRDNVNSLVMVVDVGAGTSDFSLYRIKYDQKKQQSIALEVKGASRGITEAGNYLDKLLQGMILKQANINYEKPLYANTVGALSLSLREYKESLFKDGFVNATLFNGEVIEVSLDEFLSLPQVAAFSTSLKECMQNILNEIDPSFVKGAPMGVLAIALTGGGAELPMVRALAQGQIQAHGTTLKLVQTDPFPKWLELDYPELEQEYSRIAVSLGGARKRILFASGPATVTCDPVGEYSLEMY
ncbi:hypothetical protein [Vibrio parahaemolyticus]|uniref:hypothetical protein n=1 Tax=Vibrio parahaemolyticus TaxID=670 RepID=UPI0009AB83C7|nr:hypothetical protein [Vibrio parahaemolyticus]